MTQKNIKRRTCDNCNKTVDQTEISYGGSIFSGWLHVTRTDGSTRFPRADNGPWDFCSTECCTIFLNQNKL